MKLTLTLADGSTYSWDLGDASMTDWLYLLQEIKNLVYGGRN